MARLVTTLAFIGILLMVAINIVDGLETVPITRWSSEFTGRKGLANAVFVIFLIAGVFAAISYARGE